MGQNQTSQQGFGTTARATQIAIARYLGDTESLEDTITVFKSFLGDSTKRAEYPSVFDPTYSPNGRWVSGLEFGGSFYSNQFPHLAWQPDPPSGEERYDNCYGINPAGSTIEGHNVSGVLPDDQRRSKTNNGDFVWPPPKEDYVYGALAGVLTQAILIDRYDSDLNIWACADKAIYRAYRWMYDEADYTLEFDEYDDDVDGVQHTKNDLWQAFAVNFFYDGVAGCTPLEVYAPGFTIPGTCLGWTCWTHNLNPI